MTDEGVASSTLTSLCRPSLMTSWVRFCNSIASAEAVRAARQGALDKRLTEEHPLVSQLLKVQLALHIQAKTEVLRILSEETSLQRLTDLVCRAELTTDVIMPAAADVVHSLIAPSSPTAAQRFSSLHHQALQVLQSAPPGSLLMRALRRWWTRSPTTHKFAIETGVTLVVRHFVAARVLMIVNAGCEEGGDPFIKAWAATILDKLESFPKLVRLSQRDPHSDNDYRPTCIDILRHVIFSCHAHPALHKHWGPTRARCPEVIAMLQQTVLDSAAEPPAVKQDLTQAPSRQTANEEGARAPLLLSALANMDPETILDSMFHQPSVKALTQPDAPRLIEALLRNTVRWQATYATFGDAQIDLIVSAAAHLSAGVSMLLGGRAGPQATLSILATIQKALLTTDSKLATLSKHVIPAYGLLVIDNLMAAGPPPSPSGRQLLYKEAVGRSLAPPQCALHHRHGSRCCPTAAWLLLAFADSADKFSDDSCELSSISSATMSSISRLVALLVGAESIDAATLRYICTALACLAERCFSQSSWYAASQSGDPIQMGGAAYIMVNTAIFIAFARTPAPTAYLEALVQTGLLLQLCRLTSRLLDEQGDASLADASTNHRGIGHAHYETDSGAGGKPAAVGNRVQATQLQLQSQAKWMESDADVNATTMEFALGLDKSNVGLVLFFDVPCSLDDIHAGGKGWVTGTPPQANRGEAAQQLLATCLAVVVLQLVPEYVEPFARAGIVPVLNLPEVLAGPHLGAGEPAGAAAAVPSQDGTTLPVGQSEQLHMASDHHKELTVEQDAFVTERLHGHIQTFAPVDNIDLPSTLDEDTEQESVFDADDLTSAPCIMGPARPRPYTPADEQEAAARHASSGHRIQGCSASFPAGSESTSTCRFGPGPHEEAGMLFQKNQDITALQSAHAAALSAANQQIASLAAQINDLCLLLERFKKQGSPSIVSCICRPAVMTAWIKFCNSVASAEALQALRLSGRKCDKDISDANLLLIRCLQVLQSCERPESPLSTDAFSESLLSAGGWRFTVYCLEYVTAFAEARKSCSLSPPRESELAALKHILAVSVNRLASAHACIRRPDRQDKPWVKAVFSRNMDLEGLVDVACRAEQVSEAIIPFAPDLVLSLLSVSDTDRSPTLSRKYPELHRQACNIYRSAQPGGLLMRTLHKWWLAPSSRKFALLSVTNAAMLCSFVASATVAIVLQMLREMVITTAAWSPPQKVEDPSKALVLGPLQGPPATDPPASLFFSMVIALSVLTNTGKAIDFNKLCDNLPQASSDQLLAATFHQPTLSVLMLSDAHRLIEAILRTTARWHTTWANSGPSNLPLIESRTGMLSAQMSALLAVTAGPQAALSIMATARKVFLVSEVNSSLTTDSLLAIDHQMSAAVAPALSGMQAMVQAAVVGTAGHVSRTIRTRWQPVLEYATAWLLPVLFSSADKSVGDYPIGWLNGIMHFVALLASVGALDAAAAHSVCATMTHWAGTHLAKASSLRALIPQLYLVIEVAIYVSHTTPPHPASPAKGCLEAVVQTGLLRMLCQLASRLLDKEGMASLVVMLALRVMPTLAELLPESPCTSAQALASSLKGVNVERVVDKHGNLTLFDLTQAVKARALAAMAELVEVLEAHCAEACQPDPTTAEADLERARVTAMGAGCCNPGCKNLEGVTEAELRTSKCSGCKKARYCSTTCQKAAWKVRNGAGSLNFVLLAKAGHNVALVAKPCFGRDLPANMMQHLKSPGASYLYHSVQNLDFDRISKQVGVELLLGPCGSGVGSTEVYVLDASGHVHIFGQ
ncbi:hypothetical protein WJX72_001549 [[Myrmecia] bisecta]|uniref:MYND-type domain-containing protein n=1 Tax=[Myrmecia] bisecta TaxID=41462 RepID=A0AAW1Q9Y6_9CHLO